MPTIAEIIAIAEISQPLAANDIAKRGLYGGGVDLKLPRKIYMVRKNVQRQYELDPTDTTLIPTANLLYALCAPYNQKAAQYLNVTGGSVAPIEPSGSLPEPYDWEVTPTSTPLADGESTVTLTDFIGYNVDVLRGGIGQNTTNTGGSYFQWNRVTGLFEIFPAVVTGELIRITPIG